mmetsp:Transcript_4084/g.8845  ORF Transcript_4084/g.8845 Transcript_4084/m.8845 type:complete len:121 (+) Transcript_4084:23-385(+)
MCRLTLDGQNVLLLITQSLHTLISSRLGILSENTRTVIMHVTCHAHMFMQKRVEGFGAHTHTYVGCVSMPGATRASALKECVDAVGERRPCRLELRPPDCVLSEPLPSVSPAEPLERCGH